MIKPCYFCTHAQKAVDWKDAQTLRRFVATQGKILPPKTTGTCSKHQRQVAKTIKRARVMGILPYTMQRI